jgi:hypothetical protein
VLFPQLNPASNSADLSYLAANLVQLRHNSRACDLVRRYDINYMVIAPDTFPPGNGTPGFYKGVADPAPKASFLLVASAAGGQLRLYKITSCQPARQAGPVETVSRGSG